MHETLFNPAIWMPLLIAILGVGVFVYGNARLKAGVRNAGIGIVGLAIAWYSVAWFVDTSVEQSLKRTNAIIVAVENGNWDEMKTLIDKKTVIPPFNFRGSDVIAAVSQQNAERYNLKDIRVLSRTVTSQPPLITIELNTFLESNTSTTATFRFEYEEFPDGLLLSRIVPVSVAGRTIEELGSMVIKGNFGR